MVKILDPIKQQDLEGIAYYISKRATFDGLDFGLIDNQVSALIKEVLFVCAGEGWYDKVEQITPKVGWETLNPIDYENLGDDWEERGDLRRAMNCYSVNQESFPKLLTLYKKIVESGDLKLAEQAWEHLKQGNTLPPEDYLNIAVASHEKGDLEKATQTYYKALETFLEIVNASPIRIITIDENDELKEERNQRTELYGLNMDFIITKLKEIADSYMNESKPNLVKAKDIYEKSKIAKGLVDVGLMYMDQGDLMQALDTFERVINIYKSKSKTEDSFDLTVIELFSLSYIIQRATNDENIEGDRYEIVKKAASLDDRNLADDEIEELKKAYIRDGKLVRIEKLVSDGVLEPLTPIEYLRIASNCFASGNYSIHGMKAIESSGFTGLANFMKQIYDKDTDFLEQSPAIKSKVEGPDVASSNNGHPHS